MTTTHRSAGHAIPMPYAPAGNPLVTGLRTLGIVVQTGLAALSAFLLLFLSAFIDDPKADVGLILTVLAVIGAWCLSGPFLFGYLTRATQSAGRVVLSFLACGPVPFVVYSIAANHL